MNLLDGVASHEEGMMDVPSDKNLFEMNDVHKEFVRGKKVSHVLRGVNLSIKVGEIVALVGESGSGKSTVARTIMRLYTPDQGEMRFEGRDVTKIRGRALKSYRNKVQMVFQDPFSSLNPTHSVGTIMERSLPSGLKKLTKAKRDVLCGNALEKVGLSPPSNFLRQYPHELSGGQRQRVALARSLAASPKLVLADEPVSMLDVSLRLGVLNLMLALNEQYNIAYLYITHDLASARYVATKVVVMYAGEIIEEGSAEEIIEHAQHPYTQLLIQASPDPHRRGIGELDEAIFTGEPPDLSLDIQGCPFQFRCAHVMAKCRSDRPKRQEVSDGHFLNCHLYS